MNYSKIIPVDIANGPGCRVTLFVSGCTRHCPGCFNQSTWDFNAGEPFTRETEDRIIELCSPDWIAGLTVLGGEPFEPSNQVGLLPLLKYFKKKYPDKTVWIYSGSLYEDIAKSPLLPYCDVLVDGAFVEYKKDPRLQFRGSSNQRVIDLNWTRACGKICIREDDKRGMP